MIIKDILHTTSTSHKAEKSQVPLIPVSVNILAFLWDFWIKIDFRCHLHICMS